MDLKVEGMIIYFICLYILNIKGLRIHMKHTMLLEDCKVREQTNWERGFISKKR